MAGEKISPLLLYMVIVSETLPYLASLRVRPDSTGRALEKLWVLEQKGSDCSLLDPVPDDVISSVCIIKVVMDSEADKYSLTYWG